jgi:hypothetical protein
MRVPCRRALIAALGLVVLGAGCSSEDDVAAVPGPPPPHAAPGRAADCNDLPAAHGDGGIVLGTDWSGEHHDYTDTVVVHACVPATSGGRVSLVPEGSGIEVRPRGVRVDPAGDDVIAFHVTVAEGASGGLRVQQDVGGASNDIGGPLVTADGDGWQLVHRGP